MLPTLSFQVRAAAMTRSELSYKAIMNSLRQKEGVRSTD
jgi:hypothetical protein